MATKEVQQIQLTVVKNFASGKISVQGRGNFRAVEFDTTDNQFVELTEADVASVLPGVIAKVEAAMAEGGFTVTEATPPPPDDGEE
tara:strand:+ start:211 stop:468 length:258 start_codon:yes stop_codon:yes gene_type:complete